MPLFKAYDIRGVVPDELDATIAHRIGRATARHLGAARLAVGRDARTHSPELHDALVRGITEEGVDVVDLGLCSTPMLYYATESLETGGGIMLTASHNPGQYNGFKICREHAIPIGGDSGLKEIERLIEYHRGRAVDHDVDLVGQAGVDLGGDSQPLLGQVAASCSARDLPPCPRAAWASHEPLRAQAEADRMV